MSSPFSPLCRGGKDNPMEAGHCGIAFKKSGEGRKKKPFLTVICVLAPGGLIAVTGRRAGGGVIWELLLPF